MQLTLVVVLLGCAPMPAPVQPPKDADACEAFCTLARTMACTGYEGSPGQDERFGTPDDVPCVQVCRDTLADGAYTSDRACLNTARTCLAAEACTFDGAFP